MVKRTIIALLITVVMFSTIALADTCGGSVQCECGDTLIESQVIWYDLTDCPEEGLNILSDNIILDCDNHLIDGIRTYYSAGVHIMGSQNTVTDCIVQEFDYGILMIKNSYGNIITHNTVSNNSWFGIYLPYFTGNNVISDNIVSYNAAAGIYLSESNNNTISGNIVAKTTGTPSGGGIGMGILGSNNIIWNNIFKNNADGNAVDDSTSNYWNFDDVGNYWDDFSSNSGYPYYYEIPGSGTGVDWYPIWPFPRVWISVTPTGTTTFPASGGILEYNITGGNYENESVTLDVWVDVSVPGWTHPYGPVLGPVIGFDMLAYPWQTTISRELTIPPRAPAGTYTLNSYLGEYDSISPVIYVEDQFSFIKQGIGGDSGSFKLTDTGDKLFLDNS